MTTQIESQLRMKARHVDAALAILRRVTIDLDEVDGDEWIVFAISDLKNWQKLYAPVEP